MSGANINDPEAVRALLEQLRSSQAWQDATTTPAPAPAAPPGGASLAPTGSSAAASAPGPVHAQAPPGTTAPGLTSVAALLSQLQAAAHTPTPPPPHAHARAPPPPPLAAPTPTPWHADGAAPDVIDLTDAPTPPPPPAGPSPRELRDCSFQHALPHIARLADDARFVAAVQKMKREQADLENRLWSDRLAILKAHEEKVKVAKTRATMTGGTITQFEADAMRDACDKELLKFDRERVLPSMDGLTGRQQVALERLGVPAMFPTDAAATLERQQKVMQVLEGIVSAPA